MMISEKAMPEVVGANPASRTTWRRLQQRYSKMHQTFNLTFTAARYMGVLVVVDIKCRTADTYSKFILK